MNALNRKSATALAFAGALACMMLSGATSSFAQQKGASLKDQLVGTWLLVSAENTGKDGSKTLPFGPNPKGTAVLDRSGRFVVLNINPGLPKIASNNRATATPEENKAIVSQSLGLMGTYTVNEADKSMTWHVEASTFANWAGQDLKRPINSVTADEIKWTNPAASIGAATTTLTWKRAK